MSAPEDKSFRITYGFYALYDLYALCAPWFRGATYLKEKQPYPNPLRGIIDESCDQLFCFRTFFAP